jgi:hypothetical protein
LAYKPQTLWNIHTGLSRTQNHTTKNKNIQHNIVVANHIDKHYICSSRNAVATTAACGNSRRGKHTHTIIQNQKINIILIHPHTKTAFL